MPPPASCITRDSCPFYLNLLLHQTHLLFGPSALALTNSQNTPPLNTVCTFFSDTHRRYNCVQSQYCQRLTRLKPNRFANLLKTVSHDARLNTIDEVQQHQHCSVAQALAMRNTGRRSLGLREYNVTRRLEGMEAFL